MNRTILKNALTVIAVLTLAASTAFAATPLSTPKGLALDAKGNLYVANYGGSQILVYNLNYAQQAKKTVKSGISSPNGVAFDSMGDFFVSNAQTSTVTKYDSKGVQQGLSIFTGVAVPLGLSVDGSDNIWVNDTSQNLSVFSLVGTLLRTRLSTGLASVNTRGPYIVLGFDTAVGSWLSSEVLTEHFGYSYALEGGRSRASAFIGNGSAFLAGQDNGNVNMIDPSIGYSSQFLHLSYEPSGMVIDVAHGRVYVASDALNKIDVYNTSGVLIHTIY